MLPLFNAFIAGTLFPLAVQQTMDQRYAAAAVSAILFVVNVVAAVLSVV